MINRIFLVNQEPHDWKFRLLRHFNSYLLMTGSLGRSSNSSELQGPGERKLLMELISLPVKCFSVNQNSTYTVTDEIRARRKRRQHAWRTQSQCSFLFLTYHCRSRIVCLVCLQYAVSEGKFLQEVSRNNIQNVQLMYLTCALYAGMITVTFPVCGRFSIILVFWCCGL